MTESLMNIEDFAPFADGLDHPECVTWGADGYVYAGGEAGQIYRVNLDDGAFVEIGNTGGFILGLCLDGDNNVYACDMVKQAVMRVSASGEVSTYTSGSPERAMGVPNYPVFDAQGNLYVSDSGGWKESTGCIYRIEPNGDTNVIIDSLNFANGLALSPDGSALYVVLSLVPGVGKVKLMSDGSVGPLEIVVTLDKVIPDGIAFDVQGNLYIACYTPDRIYRLSPQGDLALVADDWESVIFSSPTNITFGGPDLSTLVVASLARWHLTKGQMPVSGSPLHYPKF
ncbi:MAG: SMP-30/gluconolactonase/LRE family protein [Chloroflexi bacterium]|nr:SMP-30/gluconolactonase/LRE family protein [Chloroflexota bacterium]